MRNLIIFIIIAAIAGGIYYVKFYDAPPVAAYKQYRAYQNEEESKKPVPGPFDISAARPFSTKVTIDKKDIKGDSATLEATELVVWMREECATPICGTWVTKKWNAQLQKNGDAWEVVSEEMLDESASYPEDRRK